MDKSSTSSASWYSATSWDSGSTGPAPRTPVSYQQNQSRATDKDGKMGPDVNAPTPDERNVRTKLSTARSHLTILQTLRQYSEHDGDPSHMDERMVQQQEVVHRLEKQLHEMMMKKKRPTKMEQLKERLQGRRS